MHHPSAELRCSGIRALQGVPAERVATDWFGPADRVFSIRIHAVGRAAAFMVADAFVGYRTSIGTCRRPFQGQWGDSIPWRLVQDLNLLLLY